MTSPDFSPKDSFVHRIGYGSTSPHKPNSGETSKPRILFAGLRRSGKTAVHRVVFHNVSPHETYHMEPTTKLDKKDISNSSFVQFQIWDFPGDLNVNDPMFDAVSVFAETSAIIFVLDCCDFQPAMPYLTDVFNKAFRINPKISFVVFIHKADVLTEDEKHEKFAQISSQVIKEDYISPELHPSCYMTSIYDHSIFEAVSRVVQRCIPHLNVLERLLETLVQSSRIEKAYLFDMISKIYIATDSAPVDMKIFELCSDMIEVVVDVSFIYGAKQGDDTSTAYDAESCAVIRLNNGKILYFREVNRSLALVCVMPDDSFHNHGLIEYNVNCLKHAITEIFDSRDRPRLALAPPAHTLRSP
eukprot:gnl/Spiro4/5736_TR2935_c0_g1_i1.p1 gnl/Spiro4/5736_TR2935_c0_g1~~gnl/Spiro4/5736_TR2935_c0_g1_i1.p1  ORF type:complete len:373 (+),score=108.65 gnl/Spiro4/5736_TR2935_c0_g1_i1:48-1121(+)